MMIMDGSKMSRTEYDIKAIMYPAYFTPHKLCNIRGIKISINPDYHSIMQADPDNKFNGANMGPIWVLPAPDGPHFGPMNLAIRGPISYKVWNSAVGYPS